MIDRSIYWKDEYLYANQFCEECMEFTTHRTENPSYMSTCPNTISINTLKFECQKCEKEILEKDE